LSRSRDLYVYLISLVTFIELLLLSFVGGLVSGLGQGFDLGIEWPSESVKLIRAFLQG
jgi:cytochrome bd-type quinol oxidase subunit 1